MAEETLLQKLREGDEQSFSSIFELYWESIFVYIVKVLKDKDESKDLVQDTFTSLWLQRGQLGHVKSLKAYLYSIAHYKTLRHIQTNHRKQHYLDSFLSFVADLDENLEDEVYARELSLFIDREIEKLPEKMREIFVLSRKEHLSYKEIAEKLSISDKTVKKQIGNSLKYLRLRISEETFAKIVLFICLDKL